MRPYLAQTAILTLALGASLAAEDRVKDGISHDQADDMLKELRQIRALLEKTGTPSGPAPVVRGKLKIDGKHALGSKDAPLTIVEFADYQCSFCRQFQSTTFAELRKKYIDTGKVRFIARNMPLDFHPNAKGAAEAAFCASDQGQFWKMHELLYSDANKLAVADVLAYARDLHLDMPAFQKCLESNQHKDDLARDMQDATMLQITGTPSFFIGKTLPDGVDGSVLIGAMPLANFEAKLKESENGPLAP